jgi:DNA repair protein REV1
MTPTISTPLLPPSANSSLHSVASRFYAILLTHAHFLQAVSIDEVLMEVKLSFSSSSLQDPALQLAHSIRAEILEATGCEASIGISHNILLARLATRKAKPASAFHLLPAMVSSHLDSLSVDALPGIGWNLRSKLEHELEVTTVGEMLRVRPSELGRVLGEQNGKKFGAFARGIDNRELEAGKARQSVSAEVNYGIRFEHLHEVEVRSFLFPSSQRL